ncbi:MAG: acyltransferase, partial [Nocardioides sp.]|uniref:acyltransferase family protein n=1 Tax=Nocardioides sp. TaxID=35761 RepID=UPI003264F79A
MTVAEALLRRPNGLNLVRLGLASLVIALHTWTVAGEGLHSPYYEPLGKWAVPGFFCVSGFLIAGSRMRLSLGRFWWHRALRIFPAYLVCLVVVAFALAPLSTLGGGSWAADSAVGYVTHNATLVQVQLGIGATAEGQVWNGSLWTLSFEFAAYIIAGLLLTGASRTQATVVVGTLFVCLSVGNVWAL